MDSIKDKFNKSIGSVKKGFENEMENIELNKEIKELKLKAGELYDKRSKGILKLGENFYKEIRSGNIKDYNIDDIKSLEKTDKEIYNILKLIDDKLKANRVYKCKNCNNEISIDDKFCKECGSSVNIIDEDNAETKVCGVCNIENNGENIFCISCGNKL